MRKLLLPVVLTGAVLLPAAAMAHHKAGSMPLLPAAAKAHHHGGHELTSPGEPSGRFALYQIDAGATCTALIQEPEGVDALGHGGPPNWEFAPPDDIELVEVSPDIVQFCFIDQEPRARDLQVRVSFVPEGEEEPLPAAPATPPTPAD